MFEDGLPTDKFIYIYIYIMDLEPLDIYRPVCDMSGREKNNMETTFTLQDGWTNDP